MMIDGYAHCGISKYLPVRDVVAVMQQAGIDRAVLCQHLGEYDNSYLAEVVRMHPGRFAAVCLVDPAGPHPTADLEAWHATGSFRGVRLRAEWLRPSAALWARAVELGMLLVVYAADGTAAAESSVTAFAAEHPTARIIMTHLGNPVVQQGRLAETRLLSLAGIPGVYVQLSGLSQFCEFPHEPLSGFIQDVIREYGVDRIYWGSNFPVCGDTAAYCRDLMLVRNGGWGLTPDQVAAVTTQTAAGLWFDAAAGDVTI